ncbi:hypothetical protein M409DRAFT_59110 [Zasmidium cellare ATCC 36951]|uniref:Uncharacterized protein n=1 Tax=Zasmidium cellare ATCC 36951 TaxID=1080233 RepID=A0A6A6C5D2_ZASCE|nr:uncharacterized protein M409DRAFT_59110 [Zasmidium cellare ATCC 36951]KAF2161400.1 hypothetical protein M409DRAFT_59110 [Zasmidium cellare ATCC 36951]
MASSTVAGNLVIFGTPTAFFTSSELLDIELDEPWPDPLPPASSKPAYQSQPFCDVLDIVRLCSLGDDCKWHCANTLATASGPFPFTTLCDAEFCGVVADCGRATGLVELMQIQIRETSNWWATQAGCYERKAPLRSPLRLSFVVGAMVSVDGASACTSWPTVKVSSMPLFVFRIPYSVLSPLAASARRASRGDGAQLRSFYYENPNSSIMIQVLCYRPNMPMRFTVVIVNGSSRIPAARCKHHFSTVLSSPHHVPLAASTFRLSFLEALHEHCKNTFTHSSLRTVGHHLCQSHSLAIPTPLPHTMAHLPDPNGAGSRFEAKFVKICLKHSVDLGFSVNLESIETWKLSEEVVRALRKWKLGDFDDQSAYDMLKQLLGTDQKKQIAVVADIVSFAASKHGLRGDDFAREARGRAGVDKARYSFVATLRNIVFDSAIDSTLVATKSGDDMVEKKCKLVYKVAAYLLLDVLVDLQGDASYWEVSLGGNTVDGWSTKANGDGEDEGEETTNDESNNTALTTEDYIPGKSQEASAEFVETQSARRTNRAGLGHVRKSRSVLFNFTEQNKRMRLSHARAPAQISTSAIEEMSKKLNSAEGKNVRQAEEIWKLEAACSNYERVVAKFQAEAAEDKKTIEKLEAKLAARGSTS